MDVWHLKVKFVFNFCCIFYIYSGKTSSYTCQHYLLCTISRFKPGPHNCIAGTTSSLGLSRVWANFAELQKGCKIVLARRSAPYLRVVTNDKYCTSCHSSCKAKARSQTNDFILQLQGFVCLSTSSIPHICQFFT